MSQNIRNFSHTSNFIFTTTLFGEETTYALQSVNLPGISFSHITTSKSAVMFNLEGDTPTYSPLSAAFIVDENLETWRELTAIAQKMRNPETSEGALIEKMAHLEIHDDNSNLVIKLEFHGIMLESIGDLAFGTTSEDEILSLDIGMVYDYYTVAPSTVKE